MKSLIAALVLIGSVGSVALADHHMAGEKKTEGETAAPAAAAAAAPAPTKEKKMIKKKGKKAGMENKAGEGKTGMEEKK